jgi:hypothetical protein
VVAPARAMTPNAKQSHNTTIHNHAPLSRTHLDFTKKHSAKACSDKSARSPQSRASRPPPRHVRASPMTPLRYSWL